MQQRVIEIDHDRLLGIIHGIIARAEERNASKIQNDNTTTKRDYDQGIINLTIAAKMKTQDGGSQEVAESSSSSSSTDAFSPYSNTNVRMMHLLGLDDDDDNEAASNNEDNADWQAITG